MKKKYLGSKFLLLTIACGFTLYHNFKEGGLPVRSTLQEKWFSNVDLKHEKRFENGSVSDSALATIYSSIAAREYNVSIDPATGVPQTPNRRQNLRAYFKPGKFTVKNRVDSVGHDFQLTLKTEGVYTDNKKLLISASDTATIISENKIQLKQGILTEEYVNSEAGVRQNFIVQNAPAGTRELQVKLSAEGLKVKDLSGNKLQFYAAGKQDDAAEKLTYDGLKCWDANGKNLPATLSYKDGLVQIAVNTSSAAYPVTIDPIVTSGNPGNANAQLVGKQAEAHAGFAVASAGDVNGDGYSDVIVGAPLFDSGKEDQGALFIYFGASTGLNTNGILCTGDNKIGDAYFGRSLSGAGDVNGDGFSDIIVGSYAYSNGETEEGAAYIFYGSAAGISLNGYKIESNQATASFGMSVAGAGDMNDDGYSDVIVGAPSYTGDQENEGAVYIYWGSKEGISTTANDILEGNKSDSYFGASVAGAGDVDGDQFSDIVVGAYMYENIFGSDIGAVFVYTGDDTGMKPGLATTILGAKVGEKFGYSVSSAGDLNGDGYSDILVGSPSHNNEQGAVTVYLASSKGEGISAQSPALLEGDQTGAEFGRSVACAGDVNGDGFSDIVVGEPSRDIGGNLQEGRANIYFGSVTGKLNIKSIINSGQAGAELGASVASAGDVNGDGFSDIIVGAPFYDKNLSADGIALVFHGSAASLAIQPSAHLSTNQESEMGYTVSSAGDVNGDGYDDVIVGAPYYNNPNAVDGGLAIIYLSNKEGVNTLDRQFLEGKQALAHFGYSVSGAGDLNGDGYDDVIVGAPETDFDGVPKSGAGFVYYGSPSGIIDNASYVTLPKSGARIGASVSGAGDLNADGYDDIIIGAPSYSDAVVIDRGAVVISYGSKKGIKSGQGTIFKGYQSSSMFGNSVASAGDINGDGYDDIVVGSYKFNNSPNAQNEGAAFVYYGGLYGLGTTGTILDLNKSKALVGWAVDGAGDVNGDGFADVIVGAKDYTNGEGNEGAAAIFYGSQSGIKHLTPTIIESNQADALMGYSVGAADVNGDGYTDVLVGAIGYTDDLSKEGAVLVYHGSESGVNTKLATVIGGDQIDSEMGNSVSSAGDVNGDGFEDVIAGIHKHTLINRAFVYHGNGDDIIVNDAETVRGNIRAYNSNIFVNINSGNLGKDDFGLGLYAKSFLGRNKGRIVWETISEGQQFSHASAITNSTKFSGQGNLAYLSTAEEELKSVVTKVGFLTKVRARVRYSPALAITGQMYGPWRYLKNGILADPSVLPVELISFHAKAVEKQVDLTWETATEVNSDYFELQRSNDAKNWEALGLVYSAGDSKKANSYNFIDFKPEIGLNYYRLKMVDRDKTFAFSSIKSVKFEGKATSIFPNPVLTTLNIDSEILDTEITIFDVSGNEVMFQKNEKGIKAIDVSKLTPGSYLVKLKNKSFHIVKK